MQVAQLMIVYRTGRRHHQTGSGLRLGERNHIAYRSRIRHQHNQAIETQRYTAVGRTPVLQCVEQEAEFSLGFLAHVQRFKDCCLHLLVMYTQRTTTQFIAIHHHIVCRCFGRKRFSD